MTDIDYLQDCEVYIDTSTQRYMYIKRIHRELWEEVLKNKVSFDEDSYLIMLYGKILEMNANDVLVLLENGLLYNAPAINVRIVNTEGKKGVKK